LGVAIFDGHVVDHDLHTVNVGRLENELNEIKKKNNK